MKELTEARLVRRYKRFLADVELSDGSIVTVHCPNTGSMKNCIESGQPVWLSLSKNPNRKYKYTWEYIQTRRGHIIGVNTVRANQLVSDGVEADRIAELVGYNELNREVQYGNENSRIDVLLKHPERSDCYVEVKSVTLLENPSSRGVGYFPDAVSARSSKHLRELELVAKEGNRAVLFFCVQHTGVREVRPADHIDFRYGELLRAVAANGVELLAYKIRVTKSGFRLWRSLPVVLP